MRSMMKISMAVVATALLVAGSAWAKPELDSAGKCRDNGKFVKQEACTTPPPAAAKCRDMTTKKFAKCGTANTEPVPAAAKPAAK
jgi:hypothetical protein